MTNDIQPLEVVSIDLMPPPRRGRAGTLDRILVKTLKPGQAFWVMPPDSESPQKLQRRISQLVNRLGCHTLLDHDRGGVWVYRKRILA